MVAGAKKPHSSFPLVGISSAVLVASLLTLAGAPAVPSTAMAATSAPNQEKKMSFFELSAKDIDGIESPLKQYQGKVALVVNVASACGYTPQYTGLQKLHETYKDKGLAVLGFPTNEFGGQEPGTEKEIKEFCSTKFRVTFPMFSKVSVKAGDAQSPVYKFLTQSQPAPRWNFSKYLVGKDGQVIAAYPSNIAPESDELKQAIEAALAK